MARATSFAESVMDQNEGLVTALAGRYDIEREVGRGGMAIVYLAHDVKHARSVALKVLRPELAASLGAERFVREIAITASLVHPNILALYDSGEASGFLYYVMPYVDGPTLGQRLKREVQLPLDDVLAIARQVAAALDHAHAHGVIHRDIKPDNILLLGDHVLVGDFGLARAISSAASTPLTDLRFVVGTVPYMSPEQCTPGRAVDARSDIYSLGCVVFEMITGVPPFRGATADATMSHHLTSDPPSLRTERRSCPSTFDDVVRRALAKAPADRFRTAGEFVRALESPSPIPIPPPVAPRRSFARRMRSKPLILLAPLLLAGVIGVPLALRTPLSQNDWVLVADFDGPPDDPRLASVVRDLATQALKQSRFIQVFDRRQLNEVMRRANIPETTHVDGDRARELAQRSSVRAVLRGSVRRLSATTLELVLHVVDAENGSSMASAVGTATEQSLPDSLQALVRAVRQRLGERRSGIAANRPLRDVTTPSFEAFRKYSAALDATSLQNDHAASNKLAWEAVTLDPAFAAAWALMGTNYLSARQLDSARFAYGKALSLPNRLSPAELYRLKGDAAYAFDHDLPATLKWYDLYLVEAPNSRSGRTNRAVYRSAMGQWTEAVRDLRDAVPLNPFGAALIQPTLFNLAAALVVVGDRTEARKVRDSLTGAPAGYIDLILAQAESQWPRAESIAAAAVNDPKITSFYRIHAVTSLASALAAQGARRAADSVLSAAVAATQGSTARWYERARLLLALSVGGSVRARTDIVPRDTSPPADMLRGLWAAAAGDTQTARNVLQKHVRATASQAAAFGQARVLIDAWVAASKGQWRYVTDHLAAVARDGELDPTIFDRPDSYQLRWLVATAYERLAMPDSALAFYELLLRPTILPPGHYPLRGIPYAFALRRTAELRMQRADAKGAIRDLEAFLPNFTKPDSSTQQFLTDARAFRARLASPSS